MYICTSLCPHHQHVEVLSLLLVHGGPTLLAARARVSRSLSILLFYVYASLSLCTSPTCGNASPTAAGSWRADWLRARVVLSLSILLFCVYASLSLCTSPKCFPHYRHAEQACYLSVYSIVYMHLSLCVHHRSASPIGLYKIFVDFEAVVHESTIRSFPRPPALPTLVQFDCTIIGQYTTPLPTSRLYAEYHTI